jgi:hypothetical protein
MDVASRRLAGMEHAMGTKAYLLVSGFIFLAVGLLHLSRLVYHWPVRAGVWLVPEWLSYLGLPVACGLAVWALRLYRR